MQGLKDAAFGAALDLLWLSQAARPLRRLTGCRGVIFAFGRVLPGRPAAFAPTARAQVTPEFLEFLILRVRELGLDLVDLDTALERLAAPEAGRGFVAVTFEGAWRDTLEHALPVLRRQRCPFTLYLTTALVDGLGVLWPQALEAIVAGQRAVAVEGPGGETVYLDAGGPARKRRTYEALRRRVAGLDAAGRAALVGELAERHGLDLAAQVRALVIDWGELRPFADEALCTIGTATVHGEPLAALPAARAEAEIAQSLKVVAAQLGVVPRHLAWPGGPDDAGPREVALARELGLTSAVTRRAGGLHAAHAAHPHALPRIAVGGRLAPRHVDVLATGAPFALWRAGRG